MTDWRFVCPGSRSLVSIWVHTKGRRWLEAFQSFRLRENVWWAAGDFRRIPVPGRPPIVYREFIGHHAETDPILWQVELLLAGKCGFVLFRGQCREGDDGARLAVLQSAASLEVE